MEAGRLFEEGEQTHAEIAKDLGVNRYAMTKWHKRWNAEGEAGLAVLTHQGSDSSLFQRFPAC